MTISIALHPQQHWHCHYLQFCSYGYSGSSLSRTVKHTIFYPTSKLTGLDTERHETGISEMKDSSLLRGIPVAKGSTLVPVP